ncbi:SODIUM POTASSIUM ROOT DEFECTIVE 3-like protein [Drosera capensis]
MKRMNISIGCTSLVSTAICNSMEPLPSSSLSSGGRTIDRHNPIITDTRRLIVASRDPNHETLNPHVRSNGATTESKIKRIDDQVKVVKQQLIELGKSKKKNKKRSYVSAARRSSSALGSELVSMKGYGAVRAGEDCLDPPESTRFLLDDSGLELLDDVEPVFEIDVGPRPVKPCDEGLKKGVTKEGDECDVIEMIEEKDPKPPTPGFSAGSHQVVVLRVSLHCRGCEGKVRKHISRMQGVASFDIDFAEKKVTVIGDVTPLGVLSSISKVKNAQLLTPSVPPSTLLDVEEAVKK